MKQPAPITNAYFLLGPSDQEVVRNYFGAACDVCRLLDSLRRHEQNVAHEAVLARFERAEKLYSGIGFLPILPSSTAQPRPTEQSPVAAIRRRATCPNAVFSCVAKAEDCPSSTPRR
jgi:hypothetical protein